MWLSAFANGDASVLCQYGNLRSVVRRPTLFAESSVATDIAQDRGAPCAAVLAPVRQRRHARKMQTKTIGLIGGMSRESSAEYYRLINVGIKQRLGGRHNEQRDCHGQRRRDQGAAARAGLG
jgi:hypothetical protein